MTTDGKTLTRDPFAGHGVLLDTSLLIVVLVGFWRPNVVGHRVTGDQYGERDFRFLAGVVERARPWIVTSHLLTQADDRVDRLHGTANLECRGVISRLLDRVQEHHPSAVHVVEEPLFPRLGLADSGVIHVARRIPCVVLTSDAELHRELERVHLASLHYPSLRHGLM